MRMAVERAPPRRPETWPGCGHAPWSSAGDDDVVRPGAHARALPQHPRRRAGRRPRHVARPDLGEARPGRPAASWTSSPPTRSRRESADPPPPVTTAPLFLVDALPTGDTGVLDGPEGRHAATVRRLRAGEGLLLGRRAGRARARRRHRRREGRAAAGGRRPADCCRRPRPRLLLAQALVKGERGELAVELATEAGRGRRAAVAARRGASRAGRPGRAATRRSARWRYDRAGGREAGPTAVGAGGRGAGARRRRWPAG